MGRYAQARRRGASDGLAGASLPVPVLVADGPALISWSVVGADPTDVIIERSVDLAVWVVETSVEWSVQPLEVLGGQYYRVKGTVPVGIDVTAYSVPVFVDAP